MSLADVVTFKALSELHPDPQNPRLRADDRGKLTDDSLFVFMAETYEPIVVAESIARHGYFGSEPLIVTEEDGEWIVLEGNRRLTALMGLARSDLRAKFPKSEQWDDLAKRREIPLEMSVPVLEAAEREDADAVVGFRHISGVEEWKPLQRAQYVAYLVDVRGKTFLEVADTVGEDEDVVQMYYRNQGILQRARELDRADLADAGEKRFGTFTAALNRRGIREFIGAKVVGSVQERKQQLPDDKLPELAELSSWLYGADARDKIIGDTRNLTELAEVIRAPEALEELRRSRSLATAYALTPGPPKRVLKQFAMAVGHLRSVANSAELITEEERAEELADELEKRTEEIVEVFNREGS
jgi:hypothetical protein